MAFWAACKFQCMHLLSALQWDCFSQKCGIIFTNVVLLCVCVFVEQKNCFCGLHMHTVFQILLLIPKRKYSDGFFFFTWQMKMNTPLIFKFAAVHTHICLICHTWVLRRNLPLILTAVMLLPCCSLVVTRLQVYQNCFLQATLFRAMHQTRLLQLMHQATYCVYNPQSWPYTVNKQEYVCWKLRLKAPSEVHIFKMTIQA